MANIAMIMTVVNGSRDDDGSGGGSFLGTHRLGAPLQTNPASTSSMHVASQHSSRRDLVRSSSAATLFNWRPQKADLTSRATVAEIGVAVVAPRPSESDSYDTETTRTVQLGTGENRGQAISAASTAATSARSCGGNRD